MIKEDLFQAIKEIDGIVGPGESDPKRMAEMLKRISDICLHVILEERRQSENAERRRATS